MVLRKENDKLSLLKNKWFSIYFTALSLSKIGNQIYILAIPWLVMEQTGSVALMSGMMAVGILPSIIFGPFIGVLIDRWDRRKIMLGADLIRSILVVSVPILHLFGVLEIWMLFCIAFLLTTCNICFDLIADFGIIPQLVRKDQLTLANSMNMGMINLSRLLGPVFAGFLITLLGSVNSIIINAFTYLVTFVVILIMPLTFRTQSDDAAPKINASGLLHEARVGFDFIFKSHVLWILVIVGSLSNLAIANLSTVMTFYLGNELQLNSIIVGSIYSLSGLAAIMGSIVAPIILKVTSIGRALTIATIGSFVAIAVMAISPSWVFIVAGYLLLYLTQNVCNIYTYTLRQNEIPDQLIGRVNSSYRMILTLSFPLSSLVLGGVASAYSSKVSFICAALIMLLAGMTILFSRVPKAIEKEVLLNHT